MRQMIYPIPPLAVGPPTPPLRDVRLASPQEEIVAGWFLEPSVDTVAPYAVLFLHGNGENLETLRRGGLIEPLLALRAPILIIDYPGYGNSGGEPSEASLTEAALRALAWLGEALPEHRVVIMGWSLGAALALRAASSGSVQVMGVVAMSPWTSLTEVASLHFPAWMVRVALRERYDSLGAAARVRCPSLVIHGGADAIIPAEQGRRLAGSLRNSHWVEIQAAGHNDLLAFPEVWNEIARFLHRIAPEKGV